MYIYIYMYMHIYRERESEREQLPPVRLQLRTLSQWLRAPVPTEKMEG